MHGKARGFKLHVTYSTLILLLQISSVFYLPTNMNGMTRRFLLSLIQHYLRGCYEN